MADTVCAVAFDVSPSKILTGFGSYLAPLVDRTHLIWGDSYLLHGKGGSIPFAVTLEAAIKRSSIVIIGMSSPANSSIEIGAAKIARKAEKPYGFFADNFDLFKRKHFEGVMKDAHFLMVPNQSEREEASRYLGKAAPQGIYTTSNPEWEQYLQPADRMQARALAGVTRNSELAVLVPCTKNTAFNTERIVMAINAVADTARASETHLLVSLHPGETAPPSVYESFVTAGRSLGMAVHLSGSKVEGAAFGADQLIPGVDLVVGNAGSAVVHAMARGIPMVDVVSPLGRQVLYNEIREYTSYPARNGGALEVESPAALASVLRFLGGEPERYHYFTELFAAQRSRQLKLVPQKTQEEVHKQMLHVLLELLRP